jgi:CheY-like chemotaxis protein
LRVLVVDDDPQVRDALARLLTLEGASLALAEHGQACSDLLEHDGAFDLVLSDIAMPVLDGIRLQQRLARERPELPVILMTGQEPSLGDAHAGAKPPLILRKPLDAATLRAAILAQCRAVGRDDRT